MSSCNSRTHSIQITLENDAGTSGYWRQRADWWRRHAEEEPHDIFTDAEQARYGLADELREVLSDVETHAPRLAAGLATASMYWTLLNYALEGVEWSYLAQCFLDHAAEEG